MTGTIRQLSCGGRPWEVMVEGLGRLEAPCFDAQGNLYFSDIADEGAVHCLAPDGAMSLAIKGRPHVGGIVMNADDGGFVATGHTVALFVGGEEETLMEPGDGYGFNDLTTDLAGNIYVGMHGERPSANLPTIEASLWQIDTNRSITYCYGGLTLTNGLRVSPDGTRLYHNDTLAQVVWVSDLRHGERPTGKRVFYEVAHGKPDGMAMDRDGGVWIAVVGAGKVVRVTPDGHEDLVVQTPMTHPSAVCFGGPDDQYLYITTFGSPYDRAHTGSVVRTRVHVTGMHQPPARM